MADPTITPEQHAALELLARWRALPHDGTIHHRLLALIDQYDDIDALALALVGGGRVLMAIAEELIAMAAELTREDDPVIVALRQHGMKEV